MSLRTMSSADRRRGSLWRPASRRRITKPKPRALGAALALVFAACGGGAPDADDVATADTMAASPPAAAAPRGTPTPADKPAASVPEIGRDAVGTLRLGMAESDLRREHAAARDTTWEAEGMQERGVIVPFGPGSATALLVDGAVARISTRDRGLTTPAGLGVGATLGALRAAYGRACAAVGEDGRAVVWFAAFPGVSFALDQRPGARANAIQRDPLLLADDANVVELWVHGQSVSC